MSEQERNQHDEEIEESLAAKRLSQLEPGYDIPEGDEAVLRREPGLRGFCKHMWYHHKFGILVTAFLLLVALVCLRQCSTRNRYDFDLMYAGPWFSCDTTDAVNSVNEAFLGMADDYDGDGEKLISYRPLFLMSDEQYEALQEENESKPEDERIFVNTNLIRSNRELLDADVMTGEMTLCLVDPSIFWYFEENGLLDPLTGYVDAGLIPENDLDNCGFYIKDTDFGNYFPGMADMPQDTILCVRRAGVMNQAWNSEAYEQTRQNYADLIGEILGFSAP